MFKNHLEFYDNTILTLKFDLSFTALLFLYGIFLLKTKNPLNFEFKK